MAIDPTVPLRRPTNPAARIDLELRPGRAEIYFNRAAFVDLIEQLIQTRDITLASTKFCLAFEHVEGRGTLMQIATDDGDASIN